MKSNTYIIFGIIVLLAGGAWYLYSRESSPTELNTPYNTIEPTVVETESRYKPYSQTAFDSAKGMKRVLFFFAPWCPTCRPADAEFQAKSDTIPMSVVLFKTDYDTSTELKKKYNVTYQHTFVQVDDDGNLVTSWNGGGMDELLANIK